MVTSNTNTQELSVRKFKKVKNGLDEAEVLSTIKELIERNRNLTHRFAHLDSLTKLAERTVIQAEQEADTIKKEAEMAATSKAARIIASAEEQAESEANRLMAETRRMAYEVVYSMMTSAQRQAQEITKAAEAEAQRQAEEIMTKAQAEAQRQAQELLSRSRTLLEKTIVEKFRKFVEDLISDAKEIETQHP